MVHRLILRGSLFQWIGRGKRSRENEMRAGEMGKTACREMKSTEQNGKMTGKLWWEVKSRFVYFSSKYVYDVLFQGMIEGYFPFCFFFIFRVDLEYDLGLS